MTDQGITPFLWEGEITVRVIDWNGENGFVAVDVCRALGVANPADAVRNLDDDEKGVGTIYTLGGQQSVVVVNESGLYELIFKSRKPDAAKFRKWVKSEVLPSLRKTRRYVMADFSDKIGRKPWAEWSLEERRVALAEINTARHIMNQASAAWLWRHHGLPVPPSHLLPAWWQGELVIGSNTQHTA